MKPGSEVGNYRIVSEVGSGGMAVVYRAEHRQRRTVHAVKILNASLARDADIRRRFLEEGRIQAELSHANVVPVTDIIEAGGETGLVMPLLRGESLRQRLRGQSVAPSLAVSWMQQILNALSTVHAQGIVHRDLKPSNLFLEHRAGGDHVWIMDFGIAKVLNSDFTQMTAPIGTLKYMSPEHIRSMKAVDHRTDIYAMGVILYEMICGEAAFEAGNAYEVLQRIEQGRCAPLGQRASKTPPHLVAAVERAMSINRADRFASAADFSTALIAPGMSTQTVWVPDPTALPAAPRTHWLALVSRWKTQRQQSAARLRQRWHHREARRAYARQLWDALLVSENMSLDAAQVRGLSARAEALGLSAPAVRAIELGVNRRALLHARSSRLWKPMGRGLAAVVLGLRGLGAQAAARRAQRITDRRISTRPGSLGKRFGVHVSTDLRGIWEDVFRVTWKGYGLTLQYGIRDRSGGLIQRLYCPPSRLALPVAKLCGILKWNTLGWHWRVALRESRTDGIWPVLGACLRTPLLVVGGVLVSLIRLLVAVCASTLGMLLIGPWFLDFYLRNRGQP
jgi:tRNA A-37 threonylcarbamoyl transferase component Bud32